jgi:hypothetical protein
VSATNTKDNESAVNHVVIVACDYFNEQRTATLWQ